MTVSTTLTKSSHSANGTQHQFAYNFKIFADADLKVIVRSSVGAAMNWMSPIGPMSFVLAQNLSKADSDETESFNFNLGTTF